MIKKKFVAHIDALMGSEVKQLLFADTGRRLDLCIPDIAVDDTVCYRVTIDRELKLETYDLQYAIMTFNTEEV